MGSAAADIKNAFAGSDERVDPTLGDVCRVIERHAELLTEFYDGDERMAVRRPTEGRSEGNDRERARRGDERERRPRAGSLLPISPRQRTGSCGWCRVKDGHAVRSLRSTLRLRRTRAHRPRAV